MRIFFISKGERNVANVLLFAIIDPKIAITHVTTNSITIEQLGPVVDGTIQNIQVKIEGAGLVGDFQPLTNNKLVFKDLQRDGRYNISYRYEIKREDGKVLSSAVNKVVVTTLGEGVPEIDKFRFSKKQGTSVTIDYEIELFDDVTDIIKRAIEYDGKEYRLDENKGQVTIDNLESGKEYTFQLVVYYNLGPALKELRSDVLTYQPKGSTSSGGCSMGASISAVGLFSFFAGCLFISLRKKH